MYVCWHDIRIIDSADRNRLVLYLVFFPTHLKYQRTLPLTPPSTRYGAVNEDEATGDERANGEDGGSNGRIIKSSQPRVTTTPEWRLAVTLGIVVSLHL